MDIRLICVKVINPQLEYPFVRSLDCRISHLRTDTQNVNRELLVFGIAELRTLFRPQLSAVDVPACLSNGTVARTTVCTSGMAHEAKRQLVYKRTREYELALSVGRPNIVSSSHGNLKLICDFAGVRNESPRRAGTVRSCTHRVADTAASCCHLEMSTRLRKVLYREPSLAIAPCTT